MEKQEEDSVSIIPTGACGAFVTGLEDEYLVVRNASVSAVSSLARVHQGFATSALDFLADMFNDEISEVRLNAIRSLRSICENVKLDEEQTEIILAVLDDASSESREALRDLLSICKMLTPQCLYMTVKALLNNYKRYPMDKVSIWKCMKQLGRNHGALTLALAPELLGRHPFFDTHEPELENPQYIALLILVANAAYHCAGIKSLFMEHTWRHYRYLKDGMSELVPSLRIIEEHVTPSASEVSDSSIDDGTIKLLVSATGAQIDRFSACKPEAQFSLAEYLISDLKRIISLQPASADACEFLVKFLEAQMKLCNIYQKKKSSSTSTTNNSSHYLHLLFEALDTSFELQYCYTGISPEQTLDLLRHRVRLLVLILSGAEEVWRLLVRTAHSACRLQEECGDLLDPRGSISSGKPGDSFLTELSAIMKNVTATLDDEDALPTTSHVRQLKALCDRHDEVRLPTAQFVGAAAPAGGAKRSERSDRKSISNSVQPSRYSTEAPATALGGGERTEDATSSSSSLVRRRLITITEPDRETVADTTLRFTAGLVASIRVVASCEHFGDQLQRLRIRVIR